MNKALTDEQLQEYYRQELANFAYKVSHDLQTPLRSVIGFSNLVLSSAAERMTMQEREDMQMVLDSAKHAQQLIEALLQYSRITTAPYISEKVDTHSILKEVLNNLGEWISKENVTVTYQQLPWVMGDARQLYLLFYHIIYNAIVFRKKDEAPIIRITVEPYDNNTYWLFHVIDNGIGIDPKYHSSIFEMFRKLHSDEEYPGLGAGLAFAHKIIERHHGTIGIDSFPDQGSSVWFTLQAVDV